MKHWTEFLEHRTNATKRLGKVANTLTFDIQDKEIYLKNALNTLHHLEIEICKKLEYNYTNEQDYENAITTARTLADAWNNEPTINHKPTHRNKKQ